MAESEKQSNRKGRTLVIASCGLLLVCIAIVVTMVVLGHSRKQDKTDLLQQYQTAIEARDSEELEQIWDRVAAYNDSLTEAGEEIHFIDGEPEDEAYQSLLDINGDGMMGYLEIPSINLVLPIYHGTGEDALTSGAGHLEGSSLPEGGSGRHTVLSSHNGNQDEPFSDLGKLKEGDTFTLHILDRELVYRVDRVCTIEPGDTEEYLQFTEGQDRVTLFTCVPKGVNSHRLLVQGLRVSDADSVTATPTETVKRTPTPKPAVTEKEEETSDHSANGGRGTGTPQKTDSTEEETEEQPTETVTETAIPTRAPTPTATPVPTTEAVPTPVPVTAVSTPVPTATPVPALQTVDGMAIIKTALQYYGLAYVYGGNSLTTGTDCSGFTSLIYAQYGISLPRTAAEQSQVGTQVDAAGAKPGDLVAVAYTDSAYTGHAGIYIGAGRMISAYPDGAGSGSVTITAVETGMTYRRIFSNTYAGTDAGAFKELQAYSFSLQMYGNCGGGLLIDGVPYLYGNYPVGDVYQFNLNDVPAEYQGLVEAWKQQYTSLNLTYQTEENHAILRYDPTTGQAYTSADYVAGRISAEEWRNALQNRTGIFW